MSLNKFASPRSCPSLPNSLKIKMSITTPRQRSSPVMSTAGRELSSPPNGPMRSYFPFLKLPSEVRNMIYAFALTGNNKTIPICPSQYPTHPPSLSTILTSNPCTFCQQPRRPGMTPFPLSLLLACSQIYYEAHFLPYTLNIFAMPVDAFPGFLCARTPSQLPLLRSVSVRCSNIISFLLFWDRIFSAAEPLTGLKTLRFILFNNIFDQTCRTWLSQSSIWAKAVETWIGRGMEVSVVISDSRMELEGTVKAGENVEDFTRLFGERMKKNRKRRRRGSGSQ